MRRTANAAKKHPAGAVHEQVQRVDVSSPYFLIYVAAALPAHLIPDDEVREAAFGPPLPPGGDQGTEIVPSPQGVRPGRAAGPACL